MHWVITSNLVVGHTLVFTRVLILEEALPDFVLQGSEIFLWKVIILSVMLLLFSRSGLPLVFLFLSLVCNRLFLILPLVLFLLLLILVLPPVFFIAGIGVPLL